MTEAAHLKPCPFCNAGETQVIPKTFWTGMRNAIVSVTVRHWCARPDGQPQSHIDVVGRDEESAIAAWNRRATAPQAEPVAWISVEDRMPSDFEVVLTMHADDLYPVAAYPMPSGGEAHIWRREVEGPEDMADYPGKHDILYRWPTHWMPLPARPGASTPPDEATTRAPTHPEALRLSKPARPLPQRVRDIQDAIEGECEGLAITTSQALGILNYIELMVYGCHENAIDAARTQGDAA